MTDRAVQFDIFHVHNPQGSGENKKKKLYTNKENFKNVENVHSEQRFYMFTSRCCSCSSTQ